MSTVRTLVAALAAGSALLLAACSEQSTQPTASGAIAPAGTPSGQAVAAQVCTPCHGAALKGSQITTAVGSRQSANLMQAHGYTWPEFDRLLTVGLTRDGRWVRDVMVTSTSVYGLTAADRRAAYDYLSAYGMP